MFILILILEFFFFFIVLIYSQDNVDLNGRKIHLYYINFINGIGISNNCLIYSNHMLNE